MDTQSIDLPDLEILPFHPCVVEYTEMGLTEMTLEDCPTVWQPWGPPEHHVDLGYSKSGTLVGIRIWSNVLTKHADNEG